MHMPNTHAQKWVIILDTETAGLPPYDRIVALGACVSKENELQKQSLDLIFWD